VKLNVVRLGRLDYKKALDIQGNMKFYARIWGLNM